MVGMGVPQECPEDTALPCWEDFWGVLDEGWRLHSWEHPLLGVEVVEVMRMVSSFPEFYNAIAVTSSKAFQS